MKKNLIGLSAFICVHLWTNYRIFLAFLASWRSLPRVPCLDTRENIVTMPRPIFGAFAMYAIIEDGGRQFKVTSGDTILIDREVGEDEKSVKFDRVLLVAGEGQPKIGSPLVSGATVSADVIG